MGKKEEDIADRLEGCLDLMMFDGIISSEEKVELSRKLGVLWNIPDMLPYFDLKDIAFSILQTKEEPAKPRGKIFRIPGTAGNCTPTTQGENDVEGVNRSQETRSVDPQGDGGSNRG